MSIVDRYWDAESLLGGGLAVVVLSAVNGLPSLVVAALRNAKRNRADVVGAKTPSCQPHS
ncbi:hypothetical protein [Rhodococcus erythropolis]|uniref:Uncharacterized protein n=1 Tax=Rhodococcus erythropolis TaxID=1833 RepID=A0AAX3ZZR6_RHOER|nr:hypothetical protein [Rhodococcus erythropolis]WMN03167.1 hypothetical protein QIE55_32720 [Rhodococcus erythropolis]WMN03208.1 hypothetical protein QIE55_33020 [Rhodococcus erythropolis]